MVNLTETEFRVAYERTRDMIADGRLDPHDFIWTAKLVGGSIKLWPLRETIKIYNSLNGG